MVFGHLLDDHRRDALGRLVEQHQQRIAHQRARDRQHLLLAAAHLRRRGRSGMRPRLGNSANSFSGVHDGAGMPSGKRRGGWRPISRFSSTVRSEKMRRSSGTKPSPRRAISNGLQPRNVLAAEAHRAAAARDQRHQRLHGGRLAGAVAAHQGDHLAAADLKRQVEQDLRGAVPGVQAVDRRASASLMAAASARRGVERLAGAEIDLLHLRVVADRLRRRRRRSARRAPAR